jgi:hypothetical protein
MNRLIAKNLESLMLVGFSLLLIAAVGGHVASVAVDNIEAFNLLKGALNANH